MPTDVIAVFEETVMVESVWKDDGDSWTSYQVSRCYRKIENGQEKVSGLQRRILVWSRVNISGDGDLEAIHHRIRL